MRRLADLALPCFLAAAIGCTAPAKASVIVDASLDPIGLAPGFQSIDLTNAPLGSAQSFMTGSTLVSFLIPSPTDQGVVTGSTASDCAMAPTDCYVPPVINAKGDPYLGKYFSTGIGAIILTFSGEETALSLLWGSVDTTNQLTLIDNAKGQSTVVGTVVGSQISRTANGSYGYGNSFYTTLTSSLDFDEVVLSSGTNSFESAMTSVLPAATPVSEPVGLALFGAGLLALTMGRLRRV